MNLPLLHRIIVVNNIVSFSLCNKQKKIHFFFQLLFFTFPFFIFTIFFFCYFHIFSFFRQKLSICKELPDHAIYRIYFGNRIPFFTTLILFYYDADVKTHAIARHYNRTNRPTERQRNVVNVVLVKRVLNFKFEDVSNSTL